MAVSDQMEMALSESGRQDPVSGNDVPMGSLPEEVRDDVPAMLSEGEYVVPADVLRFYGLKFFEDLRENAKMEITRMADEGRIGGEPVAGPGPTAPTPDQPNGLDLSPEDMQQLESVLQASEGGAVGFNVGGLEQGLDQSEQGGVPTQKASMNMEADAKTDQLIERIMSSVQKNPALQQKLAAKGVGFMKGGVVQGYAHGGDHTNVPDDSDEMLYRMQQQQLNEAFNPYAWLTPGTQGGYGSSSFKDAETIVEEAAPAPTGPVKKKKVEPGGPDKEPQGPTFDTMSDKDILAFSSLLSKISPKLAKNWPGLAKAQARAMKGVKADIKSIVEGDGLGSEGDGMGGGSTSDGSMGADSNQAGGGYGVSQTSAQGGTGLGSVGGLSVGEAGRGGSSSSSSSGQSEADAEAEAAGEGFGLNRGAFISRRKKT
jgi:hypothetical protein